MYRSSRLAYFYMTGAWPEHEVDHKDRDGINDVWENLRPATRSQNAANRKLHKNNTSGLRGIRKRGDRYLVSCRGYRGSFDTSEKAIAAYRKAANELFGEFADGS